MTIQTTIGKTYVVTSAAECTVTTPRGILITTCPAGEQTCFVSPATEIEISNDAALVTESFKGAPAGSSASRGLSDRQAAAVGEIVEASLNGTVIEPHTTATGTDNANFKWCQMAPTRILSGTVAVISMPCRTTASPLITTSPVYLSVFQLNAGGEYEHVGTSENAVVQTIGQTSRWTFRRLQLTGRTMRLCPVPDTTSEWTDKLVLGGRVTPVSGEDSKITPISGSGAYVAEAVLEYARQQPKYATAPAVESHVSDTTAHITADERIAWNNKAETSALSGKVNTSTFNSHTGNSTVHVTAQERSSWNAKQDALLDEHGNLNLSGEVRTTSGVYGSSLNGALSQQNKIDIGYYYFTKSETKSLYLMRSRLGADGPYTIFRINDDMSVEFIQNVKFGGSLEFGDAASDQVAALIDARLRALGQIYLVVAPTTLSSPAAGATHSAVVTTNADGDLTVNSSHPWATASAAGSTLTIITTANPDAATREAVVTVSVQGVSATVTITQDAATPEQPTA